MSQASASEPHPSDEAELVDVGQVTASTYFWIFLIAFYIVATGVFLFFTMGNQYVTIPQGDWPLR